MAVNLWPWVRGEWRRGWTSLLGIVVLITIGGGITIAAVGGARRADTALDRRIEYEGWTANATIGSLVTLEEMDGAVDRLLPLIAEVPGVRGAAALTWAGVGIEIDGDPGNLFSGALGTSIGESPTETIVIGRAADQANPHEVTINEEAAAQAGVRVGDTIVLRSYASDQVDEFYEGNGAPDNGPRVEAEVVGIFRTLEDITTQPEARLTLTSGYIERYGDRVVSCTCGIVANIPLDELDQAAAEIADVVSEAQMVVGTITDEQSTILDQAVGVEVGALLVAALVAGVASIVVMLQALARQSAGRRSDEASLAAIGATRADRVAASMAVLAPALALGAIGAGVVAVGLSPLFPRGIARRAEVDPGWRFDAPVVLGGAMVLLAVAAAGALWFTWRSARRVAPTTITPILKLLAARPTTTLGGSLALDPTGDGRRVTAAGVIAAVAFAIAGITGVAVIEQSVDDTLSSPEAVGQPWDLELQAAPADPEAVVAATAEEPIDAFAFDLRIGGTDFEITGEDGTWLVQPMTFDNVVGTIGPYITDGGGSIDEGDVVLGEALARRVGADVGSEITFTPGPTTFTVTGIGRLSDGDRADEFAYVTADGMERLGRGQQPDLNSAMVRLGADTGADVTERLADLGWKPALLPAKVATLEQIGTVPRLLAVGLAVLGVGAVVHTLLVALARRRRDLAVVRALGFVPGQARAAIGWQGVLTAAAGAIVGIPVGVVIGRVIWKQVVGGVGALDIVSVPWLLLVLIAVGAVAFCAVCGWVVGRRAARLRPSAVLRSE